MEAWFLELPPTVNRILVLPAVHFVIGSSHHLIDGAVLLDRVNEVVAGMAE